MTANFILFPLVVLKSNIDKQILKNWAMEMLSCMMVPVIDAVLIMLPSFIGIYGTEITGLSRLNIAILQLILCWMMVPARTHARGILGLRTSALENTGLATAALVGMAAKRGISKAFYDSREAKKNAGMDEERANMQEDMSELEQEMMADEFASARLSDVANKMMSADDVKSRAEAGNEMDKFENLQNELRNELSEPSEFGTPLTYAGGLEAHIASQEEDIADMPLPPEASLTAEERMKNAGRLNELDNELDKSTEEMNALQERRNQILNDDSLTTEEKAEKLSELDDAMEDKLHQIDNINAERETVMTVDDKIRQANKEKAELEEEWRKVSEDATISQSEKNERLDAINDQINEVNSEIEGLQKQKMRMRIEQEREALAKEPATLRNEYAALQDSKETIQTEREALVRQRDTLQEQQAEHAVGSKEYEHYGEQIKRLDEQIQAKDQSLSDNVLQQQAISGALRKQYAELNDRQAYNLHERVKAQNDYDTAKENVENLKQRIAEQANNTPMQNVRDTVTGNTPENLKNQLKNEQKNMEAAKERLASLSNEDRRISQRLKEIAPEQGSYTMDELKAAKSAYAVKRSELQKEIADTRCKMEGESDFNTKKSYKLQIAKLQSEVADCNYKSAKVDQMMQGISGSAPGMGQAKGSSNLQSGAFTSAPNDVSSEYERKRAAIMERYANVDNFESPEFAGLSRERKAQLYRERAMRPQKILTSRRIAGAVGAAAGGMAGIWLGSTGVMTGAMIGEAVGSELGENRALNVMARTASRPADYTNRPLEVNVLADRRDISNAGQRRTLERVEAELRSSLEGDKFEKAVEAELCKNDIIEKERVSLFKKYGVTKNNYAQMREKMLPEMYSSAFKMVRNAKIKIVEKCAGEEYAKLSDDVKRKILDNVTLPGVESVQEIIHSRYLTKNWQPDFMEDEDGKR